MQFLSVISWLTVAVTLAACKQHAEQPGPFVLSGRVHCNYYDYSVHRQMHDSPAHATAYFYRKNLTGDFNGDGITEILYESLMSRVTGKQVDSVVYKNKADAYDELVDTMCKLDPVLKLKALHSLRPFCR